MKLNREAYHKLWNDTFNKHQHTPPNTGEWHYLKGVLDAMTWMKEKDETKGKQMEEKENEEI